MSFAKIFIYCCLFFILGIFLDSFFENSFYSIFISFLFIFLIFFLFKKGELKIFIFLIFFLFLGIYHSHRYKEQAFNHPLSFLNDSKEKIFFVARVVEEPDIREKSLRLIVETEKIKNQKINCKVLLVLPKYPFYQYGDKLEIIGFLKSPPQQIEGFNYKNYLLKDKIYSIVYFPKIKLLERGNYRNFWEKGYSLILELKSQLRETIFQNLPLPEASILAAMVLGDKKEISEDLKEKLNIVGLRHITAISGLHITILTSILMTVFLGLGFWRKTAFYFSLLFIFLFIAATGFQSSAIRAGIMGGLFLLAQYFGRANFSWRSIILAAAIMLVQNPLLLRLDIGFQLSFLATLGIIFLFPYFKEKLKFIPLKTFSEVLAMTFSAYIFTLPILIYNFGSFSLISPISNLLIVPILYWVMAFGFLFAFLGTFLKTIAWILSLPCFFLLAYILTIIDWFSRFFLSQIKIENLHWFFVPFFYLLLLIFIWRIKEKEKLKFLER